MDGKITLISPPDIFENFNTSVLFMHLSESGQDTVSQWLAKSDLNKDINIYVYNGENNVDWLLYALSKCEYKFIDLDNISTVTQALCGYILGTRGVCYQTQDENLAAIYSHINTNRIDHVEKFLKRMLND
jgi:hypothetical protein